MHIYAYIYIYMYTYYREANSDCTPEVGHFLGLLCKYQTILLNWCVFGFVFCFLHGFGFASFLSSWV